MTRAEYVAHVAGRHAEGAAMVERKSQDYTGTGDPFDSFTRPAALMDTTPEKYLLGLIEMKLWRIKSILDAGSANNESAADSCLDVSNYALILDALIASKRTP